MARDPDLEGEDWEWVALRGLRILLRVGVLAEERRAPQPVEIEVELWRRKPAPHRGGLEACLDYRRLYRFLCEELPQGPHVALLEELAEAVARFALADPRVEMCRVVVRKPAAFAGRGVPEVGLVRRRR